MLAQQVGERLVRQLLERHHAVAPQYVERVPGFEIELNPFAVAGLVGVRCGCGGLNACRRP